jgi:hypothetical protein
LALWKSQRSVWSTASACLTSKLADVSLEQAELKLDEAQAVVFRGLRHPDLKWRLEVVKFLLQARRAGCGGGLGLGSDARVRS